LGIPFANLRSTGTFLVSQDYWYMMEWLGKIKFAVMGLYNLALDDEAFNLHNSNSPHDERDINRNFEKDIPQENGNASITSQQIIQSPAFPHAGVLSSSLEAEHRLLKEMGWREDSENDETCAPLTEDEMREFRVISEQLQKNGLRRNGILKNGLFCNFKFGPWKNSTFKPALENEDSETSSSDTSDDDDV
ncbi:PREDICTED: vasculin-like, partial [Leptosomus discolor]|uniref:vasculin-like n=1 Tax=Leptosomus discolor TaxID=188344 RepID=UPI0005229219